MKFNERTASLELARTIEQNKQDDLKAMNKKTIDDEAKRKQSVNQQFWHSMKEIIFMIACAAIAIYTLIHFAGQVVEQKEMQFQPLSRYPKTSGTPEYAIKAFKRKNGFIDLDDPKQKRKFVSGDKPIFNPAMDGERERGIKKAKAEHEQALKNLKQGTAKTRVKKKKSVGRPKTATEMPTAKGQEVLEILRDKGFYDVSDWSLSQVYLSNIIGQIRELGHTINMTTGKNQKAVRYAMDEQ